MEGAEEQQHKRKADEGDTNSPPKHPRVALSSLPNSTLSTPLPAMVLAQEHAAHHQSYLEPLSAATAAAVAAHTPASVDYEDHVVDHTGGMHLAKLSVVQDSPGSQFHAEKKARKRREGLKRNRSASCRVSIPKDNFERLRCFACAKHKTCIVGAVFAGDEKYWTPWLQGEFSTKKGYTEKGVINSIKCGVSQAFQELHRRVETFKYCVDTKREPLPVFETADELDMAANVTLTTSIVSANFDSQPSPQQTQMHPQVKTPEPNDKLIFQQLPPVGVAVQIQPQLMTPLPLISGDPHVQHAFEQRIQLEVERNRQLQLAHMHLQARVNRYEELFQQYEQLMHRFKQLQQQPHFV